MQQLYEAQKPYLQKISSLPTGLPKNLKLQKLNQPQTTTSTPTGKKPNSFSSQSHFFPTQRSTSTSQLPSALSSHTKQQIDQSLNSIHSRVQNEQEKQNMMKKQSIYLYIRKYLNAEEGNVTKMKFRNRYGMYRPEGQSFQKKKDFAETTRQFLPKVNTREIEGDRKDLNKTSRYQKVNSGVDLITGHAKNNNNSKNPKLYQEQQKLANSRHTNISSRRRVNQMLKRDKQINNLHKNGHHVRSKQSSEEKYSRRNLSKSKSKSKSKEKKVNSIISEKFETLEEGVQVNVEELQRNMEEIYNRQEEQRQRQRMRIEEQREKMRIDKERQLIRIEEQKQKINSLKEQITSQILTKISLKQEQQQKKQQQLAQQQQSVNQLSLTQQLHDLQNRQNQFCSFMHKIQQQNMIELNNYKNITELKEIIDNKQEDDVKQKEEEIQFQQQEKEFTDKNVSCRIVDVEEMEVKEEESRRRKQEVQELKMLLEQTKKQNRSLEELKLVYSQQQTDQRNIELELKLKLDQARASLQKQLHNNLQLVKSKQTLKQNYQKEIQQQTQSIQCQKAALQKELNQVKQLKRQEEQQKIKLDQELEREKHRYQNRSLSSVLDHLEQMNTKASTLQNTLQTAQTQSQLINQAANHINQTKLSQSQLHLSKVSKHLTDQKDHLTQKITQLINEMKQKHSAYQQLLKLRESQSEGRKEKLNLSHIALRQKVTEMEQMKLQLKILREELQQVVDKQRQASELYERQKHQLKQQQKKLKELKDLQPQKPKQRKLNHQTVKEQTINSNNQSILKMANQCKWKLFPIKQTKQQDTITFENLKHVYLDSEIQRDDQYLDELQVKMHQKQQNFTDHQLHSQHNTQSQGQQEVGHFYLDSYQQNQYPHRHQESHFQNEQNHESNQNEQYEVELHDFLNNYSNAYPEQSIYQQGYSQDNYEDQYGNQSNSNSEPQAQKSLPSKFYNN